MPIRTITVKSTAEMPSQYSLAITVDMVEKHVTPDHPPRLRVTVTNQSYRRIKIGDGYRKVFSAPASRNPGPGLLLLSSDGQIPKKSGCWQPVMELAMPAVLNFAALEAGESDSIEYEIWAKPDNSLSNCYALGEYSFKTEYHHIDTDDLEIEESGDECDSERFEWGFTLTVRNENKRHC
jgi:hypothetical protein